jgi:hypothetical protein
MIDSTVVAKASTSLHIYGSLVDIQTDIATWRKVNMANVRNGDGDSVFGTAAAFETYMNDLLVSESSVDTTQIATRAYVDNALGDVSVDTTVLATRGYVDSLISLREATATKTTGRMLANGNSVSTEGYFTAAMSTISTSSAIVAASYDATNLLPNYNYFRYTAGASKNQSAEVYMSTAGKGPIMGAGSGGSKIVFTFGLLDYKSDQRVFAGYLNSTGSYTQTANPSTLTNIIGVGKDDTDATLQIMVNDGSGTATKGNTGITPNANDVYRVTISISSTGNVASIKLEDITKTATTIFKANAVSNLPAAGTLLYNHLVANTGNITSTAVGLAYIQTYEELH